MKVKKAVAMFLSITMTAGLVLTGCGGKGSEKAADGKG